MKNSLVNHIIVGIIVIFTLCCTVSADQTNDVLLPVAGDCPNSTVFVPGDPNDAKEITRLLPSTITSTSLNIPVSNAVATSTAATGKAVSDNTPSINGTLATPFTSTISRTGPATETGAIGILRSPTEPVILTSTRIPPTALNTSKMSIDSMTPFSTFEMSPLLCSGSNNTLATCWRAAPLTAVVPTSASSSSLEPQIMLSPLSMATTSPTVFLPLMAESLPPWATVSRPGTSKSPLMAGSTTTISSTMSSPVSASPSATFASIHTEILLDTIIIRPASVITKTSTITSFSFHSASSTPEPTPTTTEKRSVSWDLPWGNPWPAPITLITKTSLVRGTVGDFTTTLDLTDKLEEWTQTVIVGHYTPSPVTTLTTISDSGAATKTIVVGVFSSVVPTITIHKTTTFTINPPPYTPTITTPRSDGEAVSLITKKMTFTTDGPPHTTTLSMHQSEWTQTVIVAEQSPAKIVYTTIMSVTNRHGYTSTYSTHGAKVETIVVGVHVIPQQDPCLSDNCVCIFNEEKGWHNNINGGDC